MNIPFSPPDISELEIQYVSDALRSGWITTGPRTKELENRLSAWLGTGGTVCLNSQTAAAETSLRLLGIGEGDEVITCAYTYTATASAAIHVGAKVILVDCTMEPGTLEMDYNAVEKAITERTKAIIPIDLAGIPCDYRRLFEIVDGKRHLFRPSNVLQEAIGRVAIVADAAHALGASRYGKMVGAIADFTNFSFHAVKNFTTAEGGAMTWRSNPGIDNEALYHQAQLFTLHGQSVPAQEKYAQGAWEYDVVGPWYKCNMTDLAAALGLAQLERYRELLSRRRSIINSYDAALKPLGIQVLEHYTDEYLSSGHLYITRVFRRNGEPVGDGERREIIGRMAERGVATNVHYKPLPLLTAYRNLGYSPKDCPNSLTRYLNEISLPLHTKLTDEETAYVIETYADVVKDYIS